MSSKRWWDQVRVEMEIVRTDDRFVGTLARSGSNLRIPFCGVLELIAALEQLDRGEAEAGSDRSGNGDGPANGPSDFSGARSGDG